MVQIINKLNNTQRHLCGMGVAFATHAWITSNRHAYTRMFNLTHVCAFFHTHMHFPYT